MASSSFLVACKSSVLAQCRHSALAGRRWGHSVRVIVKEDFAELYKGDIAKIRAGYARNCLIPQKKALYATPENFKRLGITDPDSESAEERRERLEQERRQAEEGGEDLQAADLLRYYLRNKVLKIWRRVDPNTNAMHPGMVDHKAVRQKLSKQLKIDLDDQELVHLREDMVPNLEDLPEQNIDSLLEDIDTTEKECKIQIRQLGDFLAKISLRGGYTVPLKVKILKR